MYLEQYLQICKRYLQTSVSKIVIIKDINFCLQIFQQLFPFHSNSFCSTLSFIILFRQLLNPPIFSTVSLQSLFFETIIIILYEKLNSFIILFRNNSFSLFTRFVVCKFDTHRRNMHLLSLLPKKSSVLTV